MAQPDTRRAHGADGPQADAEFHSDSGQDDEPGARSFDVRRLWPIALILLLLAVLWFSGARDYLSISAIIREHERLASYVDDNLVLAAAAYVGIYIVAVAVSVPGAAVLTIVGGFLFGLVAGTALTVFAATVGASILFLAAKTSFGSFLREKVGGTSKRFAEGFEENAFSYLFLLRLMPLFPFWLINIVPAMFNVPLRIYVAATALGIIPGTLAYALLGDGLGATIAELEERNPGCTRDGTCEIGLGVLLSPGPLLAMGGLALIALIPLVGKRFKKRAGAQ